MDIISVGSNVVSLNWVLLTMTFMDSVGEQRRVILQQWCKKNACLCTTKQQIVHEKTDKKLANIYFTANGDFFQPNCSILNGYMLNKVVA